MKEKIITPYLSEEVNLSKNTPFHVFWEIMKITAWRRFAHHPTCSQYKHHYFSLGKIKLCVGCTSLYSSIIIFFIIYGVEYSFFREFPIILAAAFVVGCGSAIFHFIISPENKWIKTLLRIMAGFGIGSFVGLIIFLRTWWLQIILIGMLAGGYFLYGLMRGSSNNLKYCSDCPLHTAEPACKPIRNTNIKITKINAIIKRELKREKEKGKSEKL